MSNFSPKRITVRLSEIPPCFLFAPQPTILAVIPLLLMSLKETFGTLVFLAIIYFSTMFTDVARNFLLS